ncbi:hypothetical protein RJ40_05555 [Methanofollis aquaemaris]|uniref:Yip1 domain-containing protein n=2 Tax=Methanofollis aquaemaris TaxID=126734 RepID=A0A8A3S3Z3_9EURY|nr:hypothetical protein RJ40_05555 [Methanofollis aquaemaris]
MNPTTPGASYLHLMIRTLTHPAGAFQEVRAMSAGAVLVYGLGIVLFNLLMTVLLAMTSGFTPELLLPVAVSSILVVCLGGFWLHLFVYGLGGRSGVGTTFKVVILGLTPTALLGWIPGVALVGFLWSFVILYFGLQELQEFSKGEAALALVLVFGIPLLVLAVLAVTPGFSVFWLAPGRITWV